MAPYAYMSVGSGIAGQSLWASRGRRSTPNVAESSRTHDAVGGNAQGTSPSLRLDLYRGLVHGRAGMQQRF